jgi:hypothetical protein
VPFQLPARWYRTTVERLVDDELPPLLGPLTKSNAWRYVYACVLWTERKAGGVYPHLNDRLNSAAGREMARRGEEYLKAHLALSPLADLELFVDRIAREYRTERVAQGYSADAWQRNNVTGNSLEAVLQVLISRICGVLPSRSPRLRTLRGFELAPTGYHSRPDLALFSAQDFRVLISTKWTLRKERLGTFLHEAYFYRQRRADLQVAFVVSEFNLNILEYLVGDPLVDRTYHVHLPMLLAAHAPFRDVPPGGSVSKADLLAATRRREIDEYSRWLNIQSAVFDLSQLFDDINLLEAASAATPAEIAEPEVEEPNEDDDA